MRTHFNLRRIRAIAWMVLGVWLFALGAGMANACLLESPQQHPHAAGQQHGHGHAHHGEHEGSHDPSKAPCLKLCGETSQTTIQKTPTFAFDLVGLPSPSFGDEELTTAQALQALPLWSHQQAPPQPPPWLLFERLAL
ncbi:TPA: hypothetical protein VDV07_000195 [Pseudomonas aeruginosa]|nr:hypothetical protein [Pseudomonas aeruginosa]